MRDPDGDGTSYKREEFNKLYEHISLNAVGKMSCGYVHILYTSLYLFNLLTNFR